MLGILITSPGLLIVELFSTAEAYLMLIAKSSSETFTRSYSPIHARGVLPYLAYLLQSSASSGESEAGSRTRGTIHRSPFFAHHPLPYCQTSITLLYMAFVLIPWRSLLHYHKGEQVTVDFISLHKLR